MSFIDVIKKNKVVVAVTSALSLAPIVGALFAIDGRYAHADDIEKNKKETERAIQQSTDGLRKQIIEDKLFELDARQANSKNGKLTPLEAAIASRYRRQLDELNIKKDTK